jgi:rhodanese-related sulfurtransferase
MSSSKKASRTRKSKSRKRPSSFNWTWVFIGVGAVVLAVAGFTLLQGGDQATTPYPDLITVDEAFKKYQEGTFLLDVRTTEEWEEYHAPGTTLIPLDELEMRVDELPLDQEIVVVCRSGNRSQIGRDILRNAGIEQVSSMTGGLSQWRTSGYPTVSGP